MTENVLNKTTNAEYIPTILAQKSLATFANYMNLAKTVARDFELVSASEGDTIKVQKRGVLTANAKTAGNEVTPQNPTATSVPVTLDKHYEVTIQIDDVAKVMENQDTLQGYAEDAAIVLAETVEDALAKLYSSVPIGQVVSFDPTSATTMEQSFLTAREKLIMLKVPKMEQKFGYLHPTLVTKLLTIDRFTRQDTIGSNNAISEGRVARVAGIDNFESQMVVGTGSPAQYHNLIYARNAFVLAGRPLPSVGNALGVQQKTIIDPNINFGLRVTSSYNAKLLAMAVTLDVLFGVALLDNRLVVELRSA